MIDEAAIRLSFNYLRNTIQYIGQVDFGGLEQPRDEEGAELDDKPGNEEEMEDEYHDDEQCTEQRTWTMKSSGKRLVLANKLLTFAITGLSTPYTIPVAYFP